MYFVSFQLLNIFFRFFVLANASIRGIPFSQAVSAQCDQVAVTVRENDLDPIVDTVYCAGEIVDALNQTLRNVWPPYLGPPGKHSARLYPM